jgi:hypothetical protein
MSRKLCKITHETNMFGTQVKMHVGDEQILLQDNAEISWAHKNKRCKSDSYWFRSPDISVDQLRDTMPVLSNLESDFEFRVWYNQGKSDAQLRVQTESDAAQVAWSLMGTWVKWDQAQEDQFTQAAKPPKPLKVTKNADGTVTIQGKVTVSQTQMPDSD